MTTKFQVKGMTCGHCERAVRAEVSQLPGIELIEVSARAGSLVITSSTPIPAADVVAAIAEAGYQAEEIR